MSGAVTDGGLRGHFAEIAPFYRKIRANDPRVVQLVSDLLVRRASPGTQLRFLEVGSGTGRYLEEITSRLARSRSVSICGVGLDESLDMLLGAPPPIAGTTIRAAGVAEAFPFKSGVFSAVLSFNAVQHFDLALFLGEAARVLRPGGQLVIYTRTTEQNRRTIWGRYLPGFTERETRLYEAETLRRAISETDAFLGSRLRTIPWSVTTSLARLLEQARAFHYSTLRLYSPTELDEALEVFKGRVVRTFGARNVTAENDHQLILASRRADRLMSRRPSERGEDSTDVVLT